MPFPLPLTQVHGVAGERPPLNSGSWLSWLLRGAGMKSAPAQTHGMSVGTAPMKKNRGATAAASAPFVLTVAEGDAHDGGEDDATHIVLSVGLKTAHYMGV